MRPAGLWCAPKLWPGRECFILGGGPSLSLIDIEKLRGRRVIAVNNAYKLAPWIDVVFFGDCRWLTQYTNGLLNFAGLKVTICLKHIDRSGIKVMDRRNRPFGLSFDRGVLSWNLNSGACAINLAVHFGVKRIVLLGFDMKGIDGKYNWHDDYEPKIGKRFNPYPRFMRPFPAIAEDLKRRNIECVNATPGSALDVFSIVDPKELDIAREVKNE